MSTLIPALISFGGIAGSGKDSISSFLTDIARDTDGINYETAKFATDLRRAVCTITDVAIEQTISAEDKARMLPEKNYTVKDLRDRIGRAINQSTGLYAIQSTIDKIVSIITGKIEFNDDQDIQLLPMTIGRFLQVLGTDAFRQHVNENVWVNAFKKRWEESGYKPTLVPDNRFPNETQLIKELGGVAIYIERPGYEGRGDGRLANHPSEQKDQSFINGFDFVISNDGSLEDLKKKAIDLWPHIKQYTTEHFN